MVSSVSVFDPLSRLPEILLTTWASHGVNVVTLKADGCRRW